MKRAVGGVLLKKRIQTAMVSLDVVGPVREIDKAILVGTKLTG